MPFSPDYRPNPPIGGTLKNFKPDCGIASVNAASELKIVHTEKEMAKAFSGIAEDTAGYKGSKDWTRFYETTFRAGALLLLQRTLSTMITYFILFRLMDAVLGTKGKKPSGKS